MEKKKESSTKNMILTDFLLLLASSKRVCQSASQSVSQSVDIFHEFVYSSLRASPSLAVVLKKKLLIG